jgi:pimeloyl-ACP methyl ester carboxylesterase
VLDYAQHLPSKTLIVAGERDIVAPLAGQKTLAERTGAELKVIAKTGHLTHYETPAEVAGSLAELLER